MLKWKKKNGRGTWDVSCSLMKFGIEQKDRNERATNIKIGENWLPFRCARWHFLRIRRSTEKLATSFDLLLCILHVFPWLLSSCHHQRLLRDRTLLHSPCSIYHLAHSGCSNGAESELSPVEGWWRSHSLESSRRLEVGEKALAGTKALQTWRQEERATCQ